MTMTVQNETHKFRLLRGSHTEGKGASLRTYRVSRDPLTKEWQQPIIESTKPLDKLFNDPSNSAKHRKFERLTDVPATIVINPLERQPGETVAAFLSRLAELSDTIKQETVNRLKELDSLSKDDLEAFAEQEEIDVRIAKNREHMLTIIKTALKG
jgi:hypothetical protein